MPRRISDFRIQPKVMATAVILAVAFAGPAMPARGATFGTVVAVGGHTADIALDEPRGVLYAANFGGSRIDVVSLAQKAVGSSINVAPYPGSLALSRNGRFLLIAHFGNFQAPSSPANALTLIDLATNQKQTLALGDPPLGVGFGVDGQALVVTTTQFLLFDPVAGSTQVLDTIAGVTATTLPVPPATFPPQIVAASVGVSADGYWMFGLTDTIRFCYDVRNRSVTSVGYTAAPPLGPRVVSVSREGAYFTAGWGLFDRSGHLLSQFANATGQLNIGSQAVDSVAGVIYAQIPQAASSSAGSSPVPAAAQPPVLMIADADNLTVRDQLLLPENLAGRSLLNAARDTMYAVSDSGVRILPVGALSSAHRLAASLEDLVFRGNFCYRQPSTQEVVISDPGGGRTEFQISADTAGIFVSPASGTTPATVRVSLDPHAFQA